MNEQSDSQSGVLPGLLALLENVARVAGVVPVVVGCLVLAGWEFDVEVLKRILPGLVAMNPITALAFILAGISLMLLLGDEPGRRRTVGRGLALIVSVIGLLKLVEISFGWEIGVDRLLFGEKLGVVGDQLPNRMAPNTALNFSLVGAALLFLDVRTRRGLWPAQFLVLTAGLASMLALVGYAFGTSSFYGFASYIPMALHTALTFVVLLVGLLCARPDRGFAKVLVSDNAGGVVARRLLPAAVFVPVVLGWLRLEGERAGLYSTEIGVSLLVISNVVVFAALVRWNASLLYRAENERRRAEEELRKLNENLESRVAERTAELEAAAAELKVGEERMQAILDNYTALVYLKDLRGRYVLINRHYEELFHVSKEQVVGKSDYDIFPRSWPTRWGVTTGRRSRPDPPWSSRNQSHRRTGCTSTTRSSSPCVMPRGPPTRSAASP